MIKKVFISIPMSGRNDSDVIDEMYHIMHVKFPNDIMIQQMEHTRLLSNKVKIIGTDIALMGQADIVYFAKGWENSRGCKAEKYICDNYGVKYILYNDSDY